MLSIHPAPNFTRRRRDANMEWQIYPKPFQIYEYPANLLNAS